MKSWLKCWFRAGHRPNYLRRRQPWLNVEPLEERSVPAVLTVNTLTDNTTADNQLSLREAILLVNNASDAMAALGRNLDSGEAAQVSTTPDAFGTNDTIRFRTPSGVLTLGGTALPDLSSSVKVQGNGITLDGNMASGILGVTAGTADIRGLSLIRGSAGAGGAIIVTGGTLRLQDCTLSNNTATSGIGGAIFLQTGSVTVTNCTLSGNTATNGGGAIASLGTLKVVNSTLVLNQSTSNAGGVDMFGGSATLNNSIVAGNTSNGTPDDIAGPVGGRNNLVGDPNSAGNLMTANGNILGDGSGGILALANIVNNTLNANGGPTKTHALAANSPALAAGDVSLAVDPAGEFLSTDQRGDPFERFSQGGTVDIGAVQAQALPNPLMVNTNADTIDPSDGKTSLREAILAANGVAGADTISFQGLAGQTITLSGIQLPALSDDLTITGPSGGVTISGNQLSRILSVNSGVMATFSGLTLTKGSASGNGGAISNAGTLDVTDCTLSENSTTDSGGGISNTGTLSLTRCTLEGNSADSSGGGVYNDGGGTLTLTDCTISNNSAQFGAGVNNATGTATLTSCTLTGNTAVFSGGGITNNFGPMRLTNCTISGNSAEDSSGGIYTQRLLELVNCTVVRNRAPLGGGIFRQNNEATTLHNTLVAGNTTDGSTPSDLRGTGYSGSNNLIGDPNSAGGLTTANTNFLGDGMGGVLPLASIIDVTLASNGGPTLTHALAASSLAVNAGNSGLAAIPFTFLLRRCRRISFSKAGCGGAACVSWGIWTSCVSPRAD